MRNQAFRFTSSWTFCSSFSFCDSSSSCSLILLTAAVCFWIYAILEKKRSVSLIITTLLCCSKVSLALSRCFFINPNIFRFLPIRSFGSSRTGGFSGSTNSPIRSIFFGSFLVSCSCNTTTADLFFYIRSKLLMQIPTQFSSQRNLRSRLTTWILLNLFSKSN